MSTIDERAVALSTKKVLLLILGACAFVALGAWFFTLDPATIQSQRRFNNPLMVHGIGLVAILFFGLCGVYGITKLFDKKPGLVFTRSGIVDNSSGASAGFIPWSEIVGAEVFEAHRQRLLIIKVQNPRKYIERGNRLKQALNRANHKMCGSPIAISANALTINFSELLSLFDQYHRKFRDA